MIKITDMSPDTPAAEREALLNVAGAICQHDDTEVTLGKVLRTSGLLREHL
jgi:hypothetical protein